MPDGQVVLLDGICKEAGIEPLPLLEPAPLGLSLVGVSLFTKLKQINPSNETVLRFMQEY